MDSVLTSQDLREHDLTSENQTPMIDDGLRSADGIRWLHWIGALVVGVSVVGLLAARWGELPLTVQFLVLVQGALALALGGEVAHRRLLLPATSSALYFLFASLVPLLAWGAAYLELAEDGLAGWLSLGLGIGALLWAVRHTLERQFEYRGALYPAALGLLLFALPVLPYLEARVAPYRSTLFLAAAISLGVLLRSVSQHINRFFFHRDRAAGVERPVHYLPFALLAIVYVAGLSLLTPFGTHLALPLVFLGLMLVDAGEEYFRALVRVTSEVPERWPRRSLWLLASGFSLMAIATALAPIVGTLRVAALVTAVTSLRLLSWALRYQRPVAYGFALAGALTTYHLAPAIIPAGVKDLFWQLVETIGIRSESTAVVSLADLGALAALLGLGWALERLAKLSPSLRRVHLAALTFQGLVILLTALPDPPAARTLMPLAILLHLGACFLFRRAELVPILFLSTAHGVLVWGGPLLGAPVGLTLAEAWTVEGVIVLAFFHLAFLATGLCLRHLTKKRFLPWMPWVAGPAVVAAVALFLASLTFTPWSFLTAFLLLSVPAALLLAGLSLKDTEDEWAKELSEFAAHPRAWTMLAAALTLFFPGPESFFLALALAAWELRQAWRCSAASGRLGWYFQGWIGLALVQMLAAGWFTVGGYLTAFGLFLGAVVERGLAEVCERRDRGALLRSAYPISWSLAASAGAFGVVNTLEAGGSPWWPILPGFLASLFFIFQARDGYLKVPSSIAAMVYFGLSLLALFSHYEHLGSELLWLAPGLALLGLSRLLRQEVGAKWSRWLFTAGAGFLYAMPIFGLLEEITWGWQIVMLLFSIAFGAASFSLKSRSLLTLSTAAAVIDLGFFLLKLGTTAPQLLWAVGLVFGLSLMACAMLLEYRRELLLQKIRIWGREIRSWS